jgi:hypothetical protein
MYVMRRITSNISGIRSYDIWTRMAKLWRHYKSTYLIRCFSCGFLGGMGGGVFEEKKKHLDEISQLCHLKCQVGITRLKLRRNWRDLSGFVREQCGQMSLWNNRPIWSPKHFCKKLILNFYSGKSSPKVQASSVFFKNDFSVWPVSQNFPQSSHPDALRQESFKFHRSQDFDFGFQSSDFFISISFGRLLLFALTLL